VPYHKTPAGLGIFPGRLSRSSPPGSGCKTPANPLPRPSDLPGAASLRLRQLPLADPDETSPLAAFKPLDGIVDIAHNET